MTIDILFPSIMKMEMTATVDIHNCRTLAEVRMRIHETATAKVYRDWGMYASVRSIILRDRAHVEIGQMALLMERIEASPNFEVVFLNVDPNG